MRRGLSLGALTFVVGCGTAGADGAGSIGGGGSGSYGGDGQQISGSSGMSTSGAGQAASGGVGGSTAGAPGTAGELGLQDLPDAGQGTLFTGTSFLTGFGPNDRCLTPGDVLPPINGTLNAACRVILMGVGAGCAQPGLSPATEQDRAAILAFVEGSLLMSLAEPVCQVDQIGVHTGAECAAAGVSGWCYVDGACAEFTGDYHCDHAVCATATFNQLMVEATLPNWLVCDSP